MVVTKAHRQSNGQIGLWLGFMVSIILFAGVWLLVADHGPDDVPAIDAELADAAAKSVSDGATAVWKGVAGFGGAAAIVGLTLALTVVAAWFAGWRTSLWLPAAVGAAYVINTLLKNAISRPRPDAAWGIEADGFGFPSANATLAVTLYILFAVMAARSQRLHPALKLVIAAAAVLASAAPSWSRLYFGVHYATDIAAGIAVGAAVAFAAAAFSRKRT